MMIAGWLLAVVAATGFVVEWYRRQEILAAQRGAGWPRSWPIPQIALPEVDPVFVPGPHGPTTTTEVKFIGRGPITVPGGTSDGEAWILAVLSKNAHAMFEFGTCTGKTAWLWRRNAPADARIVTITLAPEQSAHYQAESFDDDVDVKYALKESVFTNFLYSGTEAEAGIEQLYGDSKQFDESPYVNWADLVFVDGSHAHSYVVSDSAKALRIVRPGGLVIWHDYAGPRHASGVFGALNELSATLPLRHVSGTSFVTYRKPAVS